MFSNNEVQQRKIEISMCISVFSISIPECLCSLIANMTVDIETIEYILERRDLLNQQSYKGTEYCQKIKKSRMWCVLQIKNCYENVKDRPLSISEQQYLFEQLMELKLSSPPINPLFFSQWHLHLQNQSQVSLTHLYSQIQHCNIVHINLVSKCTKSLKQLKKKHDRYWNKNCLSVQQNYSYRTRYAKILSDDLKIIKNLKFNLNQCQLVRDQLLVILHRVLANKDF